MTIRRDVYDETLAVLAEEMPGITIEVRRRIAQRMSFKLGKRLEATELANADLTRRIADVRKQLKARGTQRFRNDLQRTMQFLQQIKDQGDGEEAND